MFNELQFRSYEDLSRTIHGIDLKALGKQDLVVGIPRSGMIPAYMLGLRMNLPVIDLDSFLEGRVRSGGKRIQQVSVRPLTRVLVVDDSIQFGGQMEMVLAQLKGKTDFLYTTLAIYASKSGKDKVDHYFEMLPSPRIFQWNLLNSWIYEYSCVDIDGVLCEDPTEEQNDDGVNYLSFLENAVPKHIPPCKIDVLVTSRLEKYRINTEKWLSRHGVQYNKLEMLDLPDKATRVRLGVHASFKSQVYIKYESSLLFIESNSQQAKKISESTGRNVFCVENMTFYPSKKSKCNSWNFFLPTWKK